MDIRGPGRFLIPPDLTAGVGRGYTPDALDRQPSVGIGRGISKHPGRRGRSPDLRIRGSPPDAEGLAEGGEAACFDRPAHAGHQRLVVPEVVQGAQPRGPHPVAPPQVPHVGAAVAVAAGLAAPTLLAPPRLALTLPLPHPPPPRPRPV